MPNHNTHGVGFKRMRMAGLLPAAALILAVFAPSTVSAAEVKLAGAVVSGLFYSKAESAEHSNLVLAGVGGDSGRYVLQDSWKRGFRKRLLRPV